jgi:hypothetical protein
MPAGEGASLVDGIALSRRIRIAIARLSPAYPAFHPRPDGAHPRVRPVHQPPAAARLTLAVHAAHTVMTVMTG